MAKFLALPTADRWLLVKASLAVLAARVRLKLRPFRSGMPFRSGKAEAQPRSAHEEGPSAERIAWAVDRAGNRLGNATCLERALAAHGMLGRHGFPSCVRIGVVAGDAPEKGSGLIAHAWIELGGRVLLGGPDVSRYKPLLTWC